MGMANRSKISCRLHHSGSRSPMASNARQPYSLAAVIFIGGDCVHC